MFNSFLAACAFRGISALQRCSWPLFVTNADSIIAIYKSTVPPAISRGFALYDAKSVIAPMLLLDTKRTYFAKTPER
jgi:hypothetical protein